MKKIILILGLAMSVALPKDISAQVFQEGDVSVDIYYGTTSLFQGAFKLSTKKAAEKLGLPNLEYEYHGPLGIRGEFIIRDRIGVGLDIGYNFIQATNYRNEMVYDPSTNTSKPVQYTDVVGTYKIGVMGTFNFHFIDHTKFDMSAVLGLGYGNRQFKLETNDPKLGKETYKFGGLVWPFSMKIGVEARYFFTPNIGLNAGLGIGQGGAAHGGLSFRI